MRWHRVLLVSALVSIGCAEAFRPSEEAPLVLRGVSVIDGTGAAPRPSQSVVVEGGSIAAIGSVDAVPVPGGARVLDLPGRTVVPGFVDLHVHLHQDPVVQEAMLARLLEFGVTTVLNPGARPGAGVELRRRIERGAVRGPRLLAAGPVIDGEPPSPGMAPWDVSVDTGNDARAAVRSQAAAGVDWIKLYARLAPALVASAAEEAHSRGLRVVLHAGATTWAEAARAGVDMLVHSGFGTPMDEVVDLDDPASASDAEWYEAYARATHGARFARLAEILRENRIVVVPTLVITQASSLGRDASLLPAFRTDLAPDAELDDWWGAGWRERHPQYRPDTEQEGELLRKRLFPGALAIARAYHERGVRLGVGTDVGNAWVTPGHSFHQELALYQRAGIPALDVLRMATREGADALGLLDSVGTLEVGKRADLVVLAADPSRDVRATREIEAVYLGGVRVSATRER